MRLAKYQPWPVRMDRPKAVYITKWGRLWPLASTKAYRRMNQRSNQNCTRYPTNPPCLVSWSTQSIWFWSSAIGVTQRNCVKTIRSIHDSIAWGCPSRFVENGDAAKSIAALDAETDDWSTPMRVKSPWLSEGLLTKECFSILCKCSRKRFFYEKFPLPSPRHNDWVHQGI